ncbi:MAG: hypothetical protein K2I96_18365 [Lachnospiraceae bacterium]|nr:hypothetical protein [Lachnospiraceae bacterium]
MGNQFNSGYLKKHKIAFIAAAVLIVVLFTVLIVARSNKVKQNGQEAAIAEQDTAAAGQNHTEQEAAEMQETATEQETVAQDHTEQDMQKKQSGADREQLAAMDAYLGEADRTVMENQESLARAGLMQAETQQMLSDFSERISGMEDSLLCVENLIDRHAEGLAGQNGEMAASISELAADGQDTISQVRSLGSSVSSLLSDIKTSGAENFASASGKLSALQQSLSEAEKSTKEYHDSLTKTISLLQKESGGEHKEIVLALDDARKETASVLEKGFSGLESQLDQEYGGLMEKMGTLHDQITSTRKDISGLVEMIEESGEERQEEIRKAFAAVTASLAQIRADYADARQEISILIRTLEETENANHAETLAVLSAMESSMAESSLKNLENITASVQGMEQNFSATISSMQGEMEQGFSGMGSELSQLLSEYNAAMMEQFDRLDRRIADSGQDSFALTAGMREETARYFSELESRLAEQSDRLDQGIAECNKLLNEMADRHDVEDRLDQLYEELQQVFQYVSDGKSRLASALLTKGISIREDASFDEIYRAVLDIRQENSTGDGTGTGNLENGQKESGESAGTAPESEPAESGENTEKSEPEETGESTEKSEPEEGTEEYTETDESKEETEEETYESGEESETETHLEGVQE